MRTVRIVLILAVALLIASPLLAGPKKGDKKPQRCPVAERLKYLDKLNLSDDQKAKLEPIKKDFVPKFTEAEKKRDSILTAEQKKARHEAAKAAKQAGKDKKEIAEAVEAAVKLTDEQKAKQADSRKELGALEKDLREKVKTILTPEQQEQVKKAHKGKKKADK